MEAEGWGGRAADADGPGGPEVRFERAATQALLPGSDQGNGRAPAGIGRNGEIARCVALIDIDTVVPPVDDKAREP